MQYAQAGIEEFDVIGDLGHGAHGGTGGAHGIFAVDGDGRGNARDAFHLWAIHAVHELPGIG